MGGGAKTVSIVVLVGADLHNIVSLTGIATVDRGDLGQQQQRRGGGQDARRHHRTAVA